MLSVYCFRTALFYYSGSTQVFENEKNNIEKYSTSFQLIHALSHVLSIRFLLLNLEEILYSIMIFPRAT